MKGMKKTVKLMVRVSSIAFGNSFFALRSYITVD